MNKLLKYLGLCLGAIVCTTSLTSCPGARAASRAASSAGRSSHNYGAGGHILVAAELQQQAQQPAGIANTAATKTTITTITIITPTATAVATLMAATDIN